MKRYRILLLKPNGTDPAPLDQSLGARLAATLGAGESRITLEQDSFQRGNLDALEKALTRWERKICAVAGATDVPESTRLGELAERLKLLCFVSNNNPTVWQRRRAVFHIGVPSRATATAIADLLLFEVRAKRIYILHDTTEFQGKAARATASSLSRRGTEVRSCPGSGSSWLDDVRSWKPDLLYLVYSDSDRALPLAERLRQELPKILLLVGRSLLRKPFLNSLGPLAEGLLMVDSFERGVPRTRQEAVFMKVLTEAGIQIPTANHGFGWDAMTLCGVALTKGKGDPLSAMEYLESGADIEGAMGYYRFSADDHNGRAEFNPTVLSRFRNGQIETFREAKELC